MKLLAALQTWQYIAIAAVVAVALIIIICIIVWACKKSKKGAKSTQSVKTEPAQNVGQSAQTSVKTAAAEVAAAKDTGKIYHISKRKEDGKWQIKAEGAARAIKLFATQAEALEYGKQLAANQDARVMVHKLDGSFRKLTY